MAKPDGCIDIFNFIPVVYIYMREIYISQFKFNGLCILIVFADSIRNMVQDENGFVLAYFPGNICQVYVRNSIYLVFRIKCF